MLLWGISMIFRVVQTFVYAIPNTIGALIPDAINPFPPDPVTGLYPLNPIAVAVAVIVGYAAFWWLFSLVVQRDV
jgi:undecaprenyl pyrophosphate phosphatase UppP